MHSPLALYIHWPFCKAKCPYCDFNSHVRERIAFAQWKEALLAELDYAHSLAPNRRLHSIFFGGGTPSLMPPDIAEALIIRAKTLWPAGDDIEITLEANPTSVEADTFPAFKQAGVKRLSIGIQSLDPVALKFLGREHSVDEAMRALELACKYFTRYSFDLIYARPGQTLAQWEAELTQALAMAGEHLSLYQLTIEENTAFYAAYAKGAFAMPDEELAAQMYELTERLTATKELYAYEVSNYARRGAESAHNMAYWLGYEYAGIGAGAHGRLEINGVRHSTLNLKSPERWLEQTLTVGNGLEAMEAQTPRMIAEERLMMGLRLSQGMALDARVVPFINQKKKDFAVSQGLLEEKHGALIPTRQGRLLLTSLAEMLLVDA